MVETKTFHMHSVMTFHTAGPQTKSDCKRYSGDQCCNEKSRSANSNAPVERCACLARQGHPGHEGLRRRTIQLSYDCCYVRALPRYLHSAATTCAFNPQLSRCKWTQQNELMERWSLAGEVQRYFHRCNVHCRPLPNRERDDDNDHPFSHLSLFTEL